MRPERRRLCPRVSVCLVLSVLLLLFLLPLPVNALPDDSSAAKDINAVLRAHDQELLRYPHVVGVYVGLLPDDRTPCLKVMLSESSPATERLLPKSLEGYRVVVEVTGKIRPTK